MGCKKLTYQQGASIGETPYFFRGSLSKKGATEKKRYDYSPFGLTFNEFKREDNLENKFRFQEQEHIDDLGLNWDSFKWRNHQPDIGRFFNVDPLAESYVYNSPYAFAENRVIDGRELEGLEWAPIHDEKSNTRLNRVTVKVQNNSSMSNSEGMALVMDIMSESSTAFTGTDSDGTKTTTIATADFDSNVQEGDFYIELRDNIEMKDGTKSIHANGKVDEIGNTKSNRIQINAANAMDERDRGDVVRSGVHELGHTAGLSHSNPNSSRAGTDDNGIKLGSDNVMLHNSNKKNTNAEQLKLINNTVKNNTDEFY